MSETYPSQSFGFCGGPDFTLFIGCFNVATGDDQICEAADMNGDNFVGGPDFTLYIRDDSRFSYNSGHGNSTEEPPHQ